MLGASSPTSSQPPRSSTSTTRRLGSRHSPLAFLGWPIESNGPVNIVTGEFGDDSGLRVASRLTTQIRTEICVLETFLEPRQSSRKFPKPIRRRRDDPSMHESRFGSYGNFVVRSRLCLFYPCTSGADPETIPLDNRPIHGVASTFNPEEASLHLRSSLRDNRRLSRHRGPKIAVSYNVKLNYQHYCLAD